MKTVHLIIAHPNQCSLNYGLFKETQQILIKNKMTVVISDLYEMLSQQHPATRHYGASQPEDVEQAIAEEQEKIAQANLTILQFPMFWFGMPSLMKTYWENVLTPGFAYPGKYKESPLCDGRQILFSVTTQSTAMDFSKDGLNGSLENNIFPLRTAFSFVGFQVLEPLVLFGIHDRTQAELERLCQIHEQHITKLVRRK